MICSIRVHLKPFFLFDKNDVITHVVKKTEVKENDRDREKYTVSFSFFRRVFVLLTFTCICYCCRLTQQPEIRIKKRNDTLLSIRFFFKINTSIQKNFLNRFNFLYTDECHVHGDILIRICFFLLFWINST